MFFFPLKDQLEITLHAAPLKTVKKDCHILYQTLEIGSEQQ